MDCVSIELNLKFYFGLLNLSSLPLLPLSRNVSVNQLKRGFSKGAVCLLLRLQEVVFVKGKLSNYLVYQETQSRPSSESDIQKMKVTQSAKAKRGLRFSTCRQQTPCQSTGGFLGLSQNNRSSDSCLCFRDTEDCSSCSHSLA